MGSHFGFATEIVFIYFSLFVASSIECKDNSFKSAISLGSSEQSMAGVKKIFACDFEVFGKVQGVFFRKHTEKRANELGLHGWCMNTANGTVKGQLEGSSSQISDMKHWLQHKGSPKSRVDKANFSELKEIPVHTFKSFVIKR